MESTNYIFLYGTLLPKSRNFKLIESVIKDYSISDAITKGLLIYHDIPGKDFPFLVTKKEIERFHYDLGIEPIDVSGVALNVKGSKNLEQLLGELDYFEGIGGFGPLSNIYSRTLIDVNIENEGSFKAWAYLPNPDKDHSSRLIRNLTNKIIIPQGNWIEYKKNHKKYSLSEEIFQNTFGFETEYSPSIDDGEIKPLTQYKFRKKFHFLFKGEEKKRMFSKLTPFLSQVIYSYLNNLKEVKSISNNYQKPLILNCYEKNPKVNRTFPIPYGFSYVDGEDLNKRSNGEDTKIIFKPVIEKDEYRSEGLRSVIRIGDDEIFFEETGFPNVVEAGFSSKSVLEELNRRYMLLSSINDVDYVLKRDEKYLFSLKPQSTQLNMVVDPVLNKLKALSDVYSEVKVSTYDGKISSEKVSKYTNFLTKILAISYSPLLSYFISGKKDYTYFRPRENNRIEYRNSVTYNSDRLISGTALYSASILTIDQRLKDFILNSKEPYKAYRDVNLQNLLGLFDILPLDYKPTHFRPGYELKTNDFREFENSDSKLLVNLKGREKELYFRDYIERLLSENDFSKNLEAITNGYEYSLINNLFNMNHSFDDVFYDPKNEMDIFQLNQELKKVRSLISDPYENMTYTNFLNNYLFDENNFILNDKTHQIEISINTQNNSFMKLNQVPFVFSLYSKTPLSGLKKEIDSFKKDITPYNYKKLVQIFDDFDTSKEIWKIFYSLK